MTLCAIMGCLNSGDARDLVKGEVKQLKTNQEYSLGGR